MGVKVLDRFTRADSSSSLGSAESGQAWTATAGTWGVSGGKAYPSAVPTNSNAFGNAALAVVDAGEAVQSVWCTVVTDLSSSGHLAGVAARMTDINNYWFAFLYKSNASPFNTFLYAGKLVANVNTYSIASAIQMPAGLLFPATIGITVDSGNVWRAYCNGVQLGSAVTDSFNSTATKVGVWQEGLTDARLDDFLVFTPNGSFASAESSAVRSSDYVREVLGLSPDVYWPMDDAAGSTKLKDRAGAGIDISVAGAPTFGSPDVLPRPGPAPLIEGFNRADAASLGAPWNSDAGAGSTIFTGGHDPVGVSSNQAYPTAASGTLRLDLAVLDYGTPDVDIQVTLGAVPATSCNCGIILRFVDANNWLRVGFDNVAGGDFFFQKCVAGTITTITAPAHTSVVGDIARVTAVGGVIQVFLNGTLLGTYAEGTFSTATKHGVYFAIGATYSAAARLDNFSIAPAPLAGGSVAGWSNSNRLTRNTASAFDVGTGDFTLMFWGSFDPTQVGGKPWAMVPFAYDSLSGTSNAMMADGVLVYLLTTGFNVVRVYLASASTFADYSGAGAPGVDNATHCFIVERASGVVTVYIDNVSAGSSTLSGNASPASSGTGRRLVIGGDISNSTFNYYTQGRQAHTAFWKRALTAAERSLLHNAGRRLGVSV